MTDEEKPPAPDDTHAERVGAAFDDLSSRLGERLGAEERGAVDGLREAAARKDAEAARARLTDVKERHGWLYRELTAHPQIAALIDELALWGF